MSTMWPDIVKDDLPSLGLRFEVPVVFVQGTEDITTVTALAKAYFDRVDAPSKRFVTLAGVGHLAIFTDRAGFLRALEEFVRPLTVSSLHLADRAGRGVRVLDSLPVEPPLPLSRERFNVPVTELTAGQGLAILRRRPDIQYLTDHKGRNKVEYGHSYLSGHLNGLLSGHDAGTRPGRRDRCSGRPARTTTGGAGHAPAIVPERLHFQRRRSARSNRLAALAGDRWAPSSRWRDLPSFSF
jgi:hypothetical protein